jgi:hypothetical protein
MFNHFAHFVHFGHGSPGLLVIGFFVVLLIAVRS